MAEKKRETVKEKRARLNKTLDVDPSWLEIVIDEAGVRRAETDAAAARPIPDIPPMRAPAPTIEVDPAWLVEHVVPPPLTEAKERPSKVPRPTSKPRRSHPRPLPPPLPQGMAAATPPAAAPKESAVPRPTQRVSPEGPAARENTADAKKRSRRPPPQT